MATIVLRSVKGSPLTNTEVDSNFSNLNVDIGTRVIANAAITAGTGTKVSYDTQGLVTSSTTLSASDIPSLAWSKITSGTPTTLSGYGITDAVSSTGNAASASKLNTGRTIGMTGDITWSSGSFDGSTNVTGAATLATITDSGTGTFKKVTVNTKGLVTGTAAVSASDITGVLGTLPIANGGTNSTATPTAGSIACGTGTAISYTSAGTAGQALISNGAGIPTWGVAGATVTPTSTNATFYPVFNNSTSGSLTIADVNSNFTFNPSTGALAVPELQATNGLIVNSLTVSTSYSIPSGSSAMSTGPITVNSGISVTVPTGSRWVIL